MLSNEIYEVNNNLDNERINIIRNRINKALNDKNIYFINLLESVINFYDYLNNIKNLYTPPILKRQYGIIENYDTTENINILL